MRAKLFLKVSVLFMVACGSPPPPEPVSGQEKPLQTIVRSTPMGNEFWSSDIPGKKLNHFIQKPDHSWSVQSIDLGKDDAPPRGLCMGDINRDGILDLVTVDGGKTAIIRLLDANSNVINMYHIDSLAPEISEIEQCFIANVDDNPIPEIFLFNIGNVPGTVLLNFVPMPYPLSQPLQLYIPTPLRVNGIFSIDIDGDKKTDLVMGDFIHGRLLVSRNAAGTNDNQCASKSPTNNACFTTDEFYLYTPLSLFTLQDIDADGKLEAGVIIPKYEKLQFFKSVIEVEKDGMGNVIKSTYTWNRFLTLDVPFVPDSAQLIDFNGDGLLDVIVAGRTPVPKKDFNDPPMVVQTPTGQLAVFLGQGPGTFAQTPTVQEIAIPAPWTIGFVPSAQSAKASDILITNATNTIATFSSPGTLTYVVPPTTENPK